LRSIFRREVEELTAEPSAEEAADCMLLLFHMAHKNGWNLEQAVIDKFEKNKKREWGKPDAHGVVEHLHTHRGAIS
jgi:NTP pyrophosphatase (non-canonical NTP hydrolase)